MSNPHPSKPFVKGDPRRINKPKGATSFSKEIADILSVHTEATDVDGKLKKMPINRQIVIAAVKEALKGDNKHFETLLERSEGKVVQPIDQKNSFDLSGVPQDKLNAIISRLKDG